MLGFSLHVCNIKLYSLSELGDDHVNGTRYPYLKEERSMLAFPVLGGKILSSKPLLGTDESSADVTGQSNVGPGVSGQSLGTSTGDVPGGGVTPTKISHLPEKQLAIFAKMVWTIFPDFSP
jgi:hypothetical protein